MNAEEPDEKGDNSILSLNTIPVEVFLHICSFLDGTELAESLKYVCKSFYEILSDDAAWRVWLKHRWPNFPSAYLCYKEDDIPNPLLCRHVDRAFTLWSKDESKFCKWYNNTIHISTVDAVKLIEGGRIAISGSRDRSLAAWNTTEQLILTEQKDSAHSGWIWSLAYCHQTKELYSCSWDAFVKMWDLDSGFTEVTSFKCKTAVLASVCRPGLVAAGLFAPEVNIFDPRRGGVQIGAYRSHSGSIMSLALVRNFLISASDDQTISVWDLTAGKIFKSGIQVSQDGHPMTLSFSNGSLLFVGDTNGKLHIIDTADDTFSLGESFTIVEGGSKRNAITAMWHDPGFILTGSKDATVRVHTTTRPPSLITSLSSCHGEITSMDFCDPVLFIGCAKNAVELWKP